MKLYEILFEEISQPQKDQLENIQPNDRITVYHGTPLFRLPQLINGFDATQETRRDYGGSGHRGLFITLDKEVAKGFGGGAVMELIVRAKNIHGTGWGGRIGREDLVDEKFKQFHPNSFRPFMTHTMLATGEPPGLLIGLVGPKQIRRVWIRKGNDWQEYTREEYLAKEEVHTSRHGQESKFKEANIDLSNPKMKLEDFTTAYSQAHGRESSEELANWLKRVAKRDPEGLKQKLLDMDIGGSHLGKLAADSLVRQLLPIAVS